MVLITIIGLSIGYSSYNQELMISGEARITTSILSKYLIESNELWQSNLEGDGYRFVGTNPNNYVCFGTSNQEECLNNQNKYLYRIIGVFPDDINNYHVKLIKYSSLDKTYLWHDENTDVNWNESLLFKGLNDSYYLNNTNYFLDNSWKDMIYDWNWISNNSLMYEMNGPRYLYNTPKNIYLYELQKTGRLNETYYDYLNQETDGSIGEWTYVKAKIGLMYASDYALSLGDVALNMTENTEIMKDTLKTGWLHIANNQYDAQDNTYTFEWLISRYGYYESGYYGAFRINENGVTGGIAIHLNYLSVRPTFYLNSDVMRLSGDGTINNPYIIVN